MKVFKNLNVRILVYHSIILGIFSVSPFVLYLRSNQDPRQMVTAITLAMLIPFYILNTFFLIPRFLKKGKYAYYIGFLVLSFLVVYILDTRFFFQLVTPPGDFAPPVNMTPPPAMKLQPDRMMRPFPIFPFSVLFVYYALGISFETIVESEKQKRIKEEILKEKVHAELSFLKSQINPHFLFNSLNNIYSLANSNSEHTKEAIMLLSELMRYMLYESNGTKVSLKDEIAYIEHYIALQKLRISKRKNISIRFNCIGEINGHYVEPLLFIPFVENAFKHGLSNNETAIIDIKMSIHEDKLVFESLNSRPITHERLIEVPEKESSGIGLNNVVRRLELLYPNKYKLKYHNKSELFCAKLELNLQ